jgi:hypothetical protein
MNVAVVHLRSKDNVPNSLLLLAGMIKWVTSAAGRKGYKSYSLVTAVWDRGSKINCGARNRKIKMKPLLLLYDKKKGTFHKNKKDGSKKV